MGEAFRNVCEANANFRHRRIYVSLKLLEYLLMTNYDLEPLNITVAIQPWPYRRGKEEKRGTSRHSYFQLLIILSELSL